MENNPVKALPRNALTKEYDRSKKNKSRVKKCYRTILQSYNVS